MAASCQYLFGPLVAVYRTIWVSKVTCGSCGEYMRSGYKATNHNDGTSHRYCWRCIERILKDRKVSYNPLQRRSRNA